MLPPVILPGIRMSSMSSRTASRRSRPNPDFPGIKRISANLNPTKAGDGANSVDVDVAVIDTGVDEAPAT